MATCKHCGKETDPAAPACTACGAPQPAPGGDSTAAAAAPSGPWALPDQYAATPAGAVPANTPAPPAQSMATPSQIPTQAMPTATPAGTPADTPAPFSGGAAAAPVAPAAPAADTTSPVTPASAGAPAMPVAAAATAPVPAPDSMAPAPGAGPAVQPPATPAPGGWGAPGGASVAPGTDTAPGGVSLSAYGGDASQPGAYAGQPGAYAGQPGQPAYPGQQGAYAGQPGQPAYPGQQPYGQQPGYPGGQGGYPGAPAPKKKSKLWLIILIAVAAVVVIGGGLAAFFLLGGGSDGSADISDIQTLHDVRHASYFDNRDNLCYLNEDGSSFLVGKVAPTQSYAALNSTLSDDGTMAVYTVTADGTDIIYETRDVAGAENDDESFDLYVSYAEGETEVLVELDVNSYFFNEYTKVLYYTKNGTLYTYKSGETITLGTDVGSYAFSANDEHVVYVSRSTVYSIVPGKEAVEVATGSLYSLALGISNDGKQIYYTDIATDRAKDYDVVCLIGSEDKRISVNNPAVYFNYTGSQAVICEEDGLWRYTKKAGFVQLANEQDPVYRDGAGMLYYDNLDYDDVYVTVRLVTDFDEFFYTVPRGVDDEKEVLYLQYKEETPVRIASDVTWGGGSYSSSHISINREGSIVTYLQTDELSQTTVKNGAVVETVRVAEGVYEYTVSVDGVNVYYSEEMPSDEDDTYTSRERVFFWTAADGSSLVAEDVFSYRASPNGAYFIYTIYKAGSEGTRDGIYLYVAEGGGTTLLNDDGYPRMMANSGAYAYAIMDYEGDFSDIFAMTRVTTLYWGFAEEEKLIATWEEPFL